MDYLSVGALSSQTVIPDITGYATQNWVSQNFLSSATPIPSTYADVGALSSATAIPTISGSYSGSYWTAITINGTEKEIPAGGGGGSGGNYVPSEVTEDTITTSIDNNGYSIDLNALMVMVLAVVILMFMLA